MEKERRLEKYHRPSCNSARVEVVHGFTFKRLELVVGRKWLEDETPGIFKTDTMARRITEFVYSVSPFR